jgi:hypothetical protein
MKLGLAIFILVTLNSCNPKIKTKEEIEGTWILQKVTTTKKTFDNINGSETYSFHDDGTYGKKSLGFDTMTDEQGYFEIVEDTKSKSNYFLILKGKVKPNSYGDTIRQHSAFEIIGISNDSLVLAYRLEFSHDSLSDKWYNRVDYYTRAK